MTMGRVLTSWPLALAVTVMGCVPSEEFPEEPRQAPDAGAPDTGAPIAKPDAGNPFLPSGGSGGSPFVSFPVAGSAAPGIACVGVTTPGFATGPSGAFPTSMPQSFLAPTIQAETPPPPISGGTLLTTADGSTVVAADPERDQIYFVDAKSMTAGVTRQLNPGDQPGRLAEDAAGRIHVVLRGGHAIATLGREADSVIARREVCALPRGLAYDAAHDQLHVACAEGELVTLDATPTSLMPVRTLDVGTDARDVLVRDDKLFVTRFRAAELLVLNADGEVQETRAPDTFGHDEERQVQVMEPQPGGQCGTSFGTKLVHVESTPNVAWRTIDVPGAGVTMLHQRARTDEVQTTAGGYGSGSCGSGIVQTSVTSQLDQQATATTDLDLTLAVDIATDSEGQLLAIAAPGNQGSVPQLQILPLTSLQLQAQATGAGASVAAPTPATPAVATAGTGATFPGTAPPGFAPCVSGNPLPEPTGQATAVSFVSPYILAVQEREPAAVSFYDVRTYKQRGRVKLDQRSRFDTGHALFHTRAGAGVACASCHPEAGDDGHVWTFANIGARRTQTVRGGILGTEPLHWNGDMKDFGSLMTEVFMGRMSGFQTTPDQTDALSHWLDRQPALHADTTDTAAAERGKLLFESPEVACNTCHSGPHLTNNQTKNVGTGADLQVPSLKGVKFRTPLMHDGCAANLGERFTNTRCGGGDNHGKTSQLSAAQLEDLTVYLGTL